MKRGWCGLHRSAAPGAEGRIEKDGEWSWGQAEAAWKGTKDLLVSSGVQALPWGLLAAFLPLDVDGLALKFKAIWQVPEMILAIDLMG